MTQVKVLYQKTPFWRVGEDRPPRSSADLAARLKEFAALRSAERYPGDYCGRVIGVLPAWAEFSPADLADPRRAVALMSDGDTARLRSRRAKVVGKGTADVTFDDRLGAVAVELAKRWDDPELEEKIAAAEVASAIEDNERRDADQERALTDWRETVADCLALGAVLDTPPPRHPGRLPVPENRFDVEVARVSRLLLRTVAHTGAGLYKVQGSGTMPTPDHLWAMETVDPTDDGSPGGNSGTGSNVTVVGGEIESALEFDGNNSNVNVGDVAELNAVQKFSIAFRMNQDVIDVTDIILQKRLNDLNRIRIRTASTGRFEVNINDGGTRQGWFDYDTAIPAGSWHSVIVVYDGTETGDANRLKVYVDGIQVALTFSGSIPASTPNLSGVDALIGYTSTALDGKLDDFRIIADALTDAQAKFLAGRGLAHWDTIASAVKDNGTSTITLTTGQARDFAGEVFISGGNAYAIQTKTDDTHLVVIGDASGESGACSISPYALIQSALDQLWADQGATLFTATQYVRVFAGTYNENVLPNAGLAPVYGAEALVVEGDPADNRDNIVIAPSSGTAFQSGVIHTLLRHLKITPVAVVVYGVYLTSFEPAVSDIYVVGSILNPIYMSRNGKVEDSVIETSRNNAGTEGVYLGGAGTVLNCMVVETSVGISGTGMWVGSSKSHVEGTTIRGFATGILTYDGRSHFDLDVRNVTIYGCVTGIRLGAYVAAAGLNMFNAIISTVTTCIRVGHYPDEDAALLGPPVTLRNNCFHSYTTFADDGSATKTYAEFIALSRCDADGDLDNTDPLMTDPGSGDFSLQAASPCRGTGHGSGLIAYVDGVAAHANHPNIGAEGTASDPPAPTWSGGLSNISATDAAICGKIALAWDAASIGGSGLSVEYAAQRRIGAGAWATMWIGSETSVDICGNVAGQLYEFRVGARCADYEQAWVYATDSDTATATTPSDLSPPTISSWSVSGTTVTVTLAGVAGRTYRVRLMDAVGGEDDEQGRTGSGDVAVTAAGYGARYFCAWEYSNGIQSEPTGVYVVNIKDPAVDVAYYRVRTVTALPGAPHKTAILERIERPIQP